MTYCEQSLNGAPPPAGFDCDEFPFAATHEGSAQENQLNVAVEYVPAEHNRSVGGKLRGFWQVWRVLGSDIDGQFRQSPFESFYVAPD